MPRAARAGPQRRQPEPGVEEDERKRPLPLVGEGEEAPQLRIGEGGDEPARHLRSAKPSEASRRGDLLGRAPVAERLETPDVAGDRLGRERGPQLEEPGPQLGRWNGVDRPRLAEPADGPTAIDGSGLSVPSSTQHCTPMWRRLAVSRQQNVRAKYSEAR